jgi:hypothetical protein
MSASELGKVPVVYEREIEQGYADFHRKLNRVLRTRDVKPSRPEKLTGNGKDLLGQEKDDG